MSSTLWRSRRRGERPLIYGRERERAQLRELLDDAIAGHGSLILISGEAGIGKTTLADDLIHEADGRGCLVADGQQAAEELLADRIHSTQVENQALASIEDLAKVEAVLRLAEACEMPVDYKRDLRAALSASTSAGPGSPPLFRGLHRVMRSDPRSYDRRASASVI